MSTPVRRITIEDLMAVTGLGPNTTRRLVREGRLPGEMVGSHYVCPPGEFDRYVRGDWEPRPQPASVPMQLLHKRTA